MGTTASYVYYTFGRRIQKTVNSAATKFFYDGDDIIAEYDGSNNLLRKYVHGLSIDEPVAMISGANTYYYLSDGLGSVSELTNSAGSILEKYSYDSFEQTTIKDPNNNVLTTSAYGNRYGFTGRELDTETGLYHYRARAYSPTLGRFLQRDPIGYAADINLYRYCGNNGVNYVDPSGLDSTNIFNPFSSGPIFSYGLPLPFPVPITSSISDILNGLLNKSKDKTCEKTQEENDEGGAKATGSALEC